MAVGAESGDPVHAKRIGVAIAENCELERPPRARCRLAAIVSGAR